MSQNNTKRFWHYVKGKKRDNVGISPLLNKGHLESNNRKKAEILVGEFCLVFTKIKEGVLPKVRKFIPTPLTHIRITPAGFTKLLKNVKVNKASGPDYIPNLIFKECADELILAVTCLSPRSIDSDSLPTDWTSPKIFLVFKKGDRRKAKNYRPVSLTLVLSKLFEHIICHSMMSHFKKHRVHTNLNRGFRSGFSPETQLAVTIDDLTRKLDRGHQTDVVILDFSKAFNTVLHNLLIHKLYSYGIRVQLLLCFNKYKRREGRLIVASRLTIEDIFQYWFSIFEEDRCINSLFCHH